MSGLIGTQLGQYHLIEVIGRGGMATVYRAYQPSLDRYVAVKVLQHTDDPVFAARFKREARTIAQLQHPNILPIHDFGEQNGVLYLVLQYIENGASVGDILGEPLPLLPALRLIEHLLDGLAYAHAHGVIHRDIKPSNILMHSPAWPMLADFGIAKLNDNLHLTSSGLVLGTAMYMAPEQATGAPIDAHTDLYSTGVVLYEMVTGRLPFDAQMPLAMLMKHAYHPPLPPRSFNPDLPLEVEDILLRVLAKDPSERYQSAFEMRTAVEQAAVRIEQGTTQRFRRSIQPAPAPVGPAMAPQAAASAVTPPSPERSTTHPLGRSVRSAPAPIGPAVAPQAAASAITPPPLSRGVVASVQPKQSSRHIGPLVWFITGILTVLLVLTVLLLVLVPDIGLSGSTETPIPLPSPQTVPLVIPPTAVGEEPTEAGLLAAWTATAGPAMTATPTPTPPSPTATTTPLPDAIVRVAELRLRTGPGPAYPVVATYPQGTPFKVLGKTPTGTWLKVEAPDGRSGWMAAEFLQITIDLANVPILEIPPSPTPLPTVKPKPTARPRQAPRPTPTAPPPQPTAAPAPTQAPTALPTATPEPPTPEPEPPRPTKTPRPAPTKTPAP